MVEPLVEDFGRSDSFSHEMDSLLKQASTMFASSIARSSPLSHDGIENFVHRTSTPTDVGRQLSGNANEAHGL